MTRLLEVVKTMVAYVEFSFLYLPKMMLCFCFDLFALSWHVFLITYALELDLVH